MAFLITAFRTSDHERMAQARHIRQVVFRDEQGVSALEEWDDKDDHCEHFLLMDEGIAVGTARVRPYGPGIFKVERVAVLKERRGSGAGTLIMRAIMEHLRAAKVSTIVLNAQTAVEDFYTKIGFVSEGEVFIEADIPHIHMVWRP